MMRMRRAVHLSLLPDLGSMCHCGRLGVGMVGGDGFLSGA